MSLVDRVIVMPYPNTKGIVLTGLTPGTIYNVRIRAVGGSTQYSEWSATMSAMAT